MSSSSSIVSIDEDALEKAVLDSVSEGRAVCPCWAPRLPLKFDTLAEEINYIALGQLLDFGRSHDSALRTSLGRTSREVVEYGLMACHLDGLTLDATCIAHFTKQQVIVLLSEDQMHMGRKKECGFLWFNLCWHAKAVEGLSRGFES